MPGGPRKFPIHPIRDIEARYVKYAACGVFAIVTVDFEPGQGVGFELALAGDVRFVFGPDGGDCEYRSVFTYLDELAEGIREELAAEKQVLADVKVILRRMVIHPVDSNERSFRAAGKLAARAALEYANRDANTSVPKRKTGRVTLPLVARDAVPAVLVTNDDIASALDSEDIGRYSSS
jgi:hypothetical protein